MVGEQYIGKQIVNWKLFGDITMFDNFFLIKAHLIKAPPSYNNNNPNEINYHWNLACRLYSEVIGDMKLCLYQNIWPTQRNTIYV